MGVAGPNRMRFETGVGKSMHPIPNAGKLEPKCIILCKNGKVLECKESDAVNGEPSLL